MSNFKIFAILLAILCVLVFTTNTQKNNIEHFPSTVSNNILTNITTTGELQYADTNVNPNNLQWTKINNSSLEVLKIKQFAINDYNLCYLDFSNNIFYCQDYRNPVWKMLNGYFNATSYVSIYNNIIVININYNICQYIDTNNLQNTFTQLGGTLNQAVIKNNHIFGVNNNAVWYLQDYKIQSWVNISTNLQYKLIYIDAYDTIIVGINTMKNLVYADTYSTNDFTQPIWSVLDTPSNLLFTHVSICNGILCAKTTTNETYYRANYKTGDWINITNRLTDSSLLLPSINNTMVGLNSSGEIYYAQNITLETPQWTQIVFNKIKQISIYNNKIYGLSTNNILFYSDNYITPTWTIIRANISSFVLDNYNDSYQLILYIDIEGNTGYFKQSAPSYTNFISNKIIQITYSNNQFYCISNDKLQYYPNIYKFSAKLVYDVSNMINNIQIKYIDLYNNIIACITANNNLYYAIDKLATPTWINIPTDLVLSRITIVNNKLYGIGNSISSWKYITDLPPKVLLLDPPSDAPKVVSSTLLSKSSNAKCKVQFSPNLKSYNDTNTHSGYKTDCLIKDEYCVIDRSLIKNKKFVDGKCKYGKLNSKTKYYEFI